MDSPRRAIPVAKKTNRRNRRKTSQAEAQRFVVKILCGRVPPCPAAVVRALPQHALTAAALEEKSPLADPRMPPSREYVLETHRVWRRLPVKCGVGRRTGRFRVCMRARARPCACVTARRARLVCRPGAAAVSQRGKLKLVMGSNLLFV